MFGRKRWRPLADAERREAAGRLIGPQGLTEKQTTFGTPDVIKAWAEAHAQGADASEIRRLAGAFTSIAGVVETAPGDPGRSARYSTRELVRVERRALALVDASRRAVAPSTSEAAVSTVEDASGAGGRALGADQSEMLRHVCRSTDGIVCVVGQAGAGKTTATQAVAQAFIAEGFRVIGAAPSGNAAERLQDETGIPSMTLHRLLIDARRDGGLPAAAVLIVDEAGMAETRVLGPVLELVAQSGGKAVLIGDTAQLPAVGAGGLFAAIVDRLGAAELTENRRQRDVTEREALTRIRNGWGRDYLDWADDRGTLIRCDDAIATRARLLADWWQAAREELPGSVMIAFERRDVAELNLMARRLMQAADRLHGPELAVAGQAFAAGDRVVCTRNNDRLGVQNGTRGTVRSVDVDARTVVIATDRGDDVRLTAAYLEGRRLRHAYALTGHAGQGATVEHAFVLGHDRGRLQEWGYVALSRSRERTAIYVCEGIDRAPNGVDGGTERVARALERPSDERLAVETEVGSVSAAGDRPSWRAGPRSHSFASGFVV